MLIQKRQDAMSPRRLNASNIARISAVISPTDPDLILLASIVEGVPVIVDPDFIPDPKPPKSSPIYDEAACAVDRMWYDLYLKGFILLFPSAALRNWHAIRNFPLSYSRPGWAKKRGDTARTTNKQPLCR